MARHKGTNTGIQGPTQRADGYWVARIETGYTTKGTRRRPSVVRRTKREALAAAKELLRDYQERGPQALQARTVTVAALSRHWLDTRVSRLAPRTQDQYRMYAAQFFIPALGRRKVRDLTVADIETITAPALAAGQIHYANGALRAFKTMLRYGQSLGVDVPPALLSVAPSGRATSTRTAMTDREIGAVLGVLEGYPNRSRWYLPMLYATRKSEGMGLTWDRVDLDRGTITLDRQLTRVRYNADGTLAYPEGREHLYAQIHRGMHLGPVKTDNRALVLPLVGTLRAELAQWKEISTPGPHGLIWARSATLPLNEAQDRAQWHEIQAKANVSHPEGRPYYEHELKHTAATLLTSLGVPDTARTAILGHADTASARPYVHHVTDDVTTALERLDQRLQANRATLATQRLQDHNHRASRHAPPFALESLHACGPWPPSPRCALATLAAFDC